MQQFEDHKERRSRGESRSDSRPKENDVPSQRPCKLCSSFRLTVSRFSRSRLASSIPAFFGRTLKDSSHLLLWYPIPPDCTRQHTITHAHQNESNSSRPMKPGGPGSIAMLPRSRFKHKGCAWSLDPKLWTSKGSEFKHYRMGCISERGTMNTFAPLLTAPMAPPSTLETVNHLDWAAVL